MLQATIYLVSFLAGAIVVFGIIELMIIRKNKRTTNHLELHGIDFDQPETRREVVDAVVEAQRRGELHRLRVHDPLKLYSRE